MSAAKILIEIRKIMKPKSWVRKFFKVAVNDADDGNDDDSGDNNVQEYGNSHNKWGLRRQHRNNGVGDGIDDNDDNRQQRRWLQKQELKQ